MKILLFFLGLLTIVAGQAQAVLVAEWRMDDGTGQIVTDTSGNSNDAHLGYDTAIETSDPTWVTYGTYGSALNFDGDDRVVTPVNIDPSAITEMMVAAWIRADSLPSPWQAIVSNDNGGYDRAIMVNENGNYHVFAGRDINTNIPFTVGEWEHVVAYWSPTEVRFYKDGNFVYSTGGETVDTGGTTNIGSDTNSNWQFKGDIADVRIWSHLLSDSEVATLYQNTSNSVGGTLSGLASGNILILRNNSGDDLALENNGSFTFAKRFVIGSTYSASVLTQPTSPNQTCSVTNGNGTLTGANITNINVNCVTNTYTIGGRVSGLGPGNSLVLQNNSGDDLSVTANGDFTFTTALADESPYSVTLKVLTQPITSYQTCRVINSKGILSGDNITNADVICFDRSVLLYMPAILNNSREGK